MAMALSWAVAEAGVGGIDMALDTGWEFAQVDSLTWRSATVPGTVHGDLLAHGLLPDPFRGTNERLVQWVENEDWIYRTRFDVEPNMLSAPQIDLMAEGLDTYAEVYLNGALVMRTDNMFVGHEAPVKALLREKDNRLAIYFRSPMRGALGNALTEAFNYPADNDHHERHQSVYTRKAPYSYGWDWGIRMATSGIWRPIGLRFGGDVAIADYATRVVEATEGGKALIDNTLTLTNRGASARDIEIATAVTLEGDTLSTARTSLHVNPGDTTLTFTTTIERARLWWPNGLGDSPLYTFSVALSERSEPGWTDNRSHRVGLRTLRVVNEPDSAGETFAFEVNGQPVFAKGANYIPQDALLPSVDEGRLREMLEAARDANMNMLRVWGGGIYPPDAFFDLADEYGILIWQDFMFACTPYPTDRAFLDNVRREADYNIRRLRNHASLAMWCGNNEILEALKYYGWQRQFAPEDYAKMASSYDPLFRELLAERVGELDPGRFYLHGSPYHANWGRPATWGTGDSHNWGVWYGRKPFESLDDDLPRFMSEFGFQSFPEMKTIKHFADTADFRLDSEVMTAHQKSSIGNELILEYMERDYRVPTRFEDFVYVGLVMQGDGIGRGLMAHRRNRPYCMGTLFWQLNDSWPVVSWSAIDYYGNRKALYYAARRAFRPVAIDAYGSDDTLRISILNDRLETLDGYRLSLERIAFDGEREHLGDFVAPAIATGVTGIATLPYDSLANEAERRNSLMLLTLTTPDGREADRALFYFNKPKDLDLPDPGLTCKAEWRDSEATITLYADKLAKSVFIEIPIDGIVLSDNFFDMLPGETRVVTATSPALKAGERHEIQLTHLQKTL